MSKIHKIGGFIGARGDIYSEYINKETGAITYRKNGRYYSERNYRRAEPFARTPLEKPDTKGISLEGPRPTMPEAARLDRRGRWIAGPDAKLIFPGRLRSGQIIRDPRILTALRKIQRDRIFFWTFRQRHPNDTEEQARRRYAEMLRRLAKAKGKLQKDRVLVQYGFLPETI